MTDSFRVPPFEDDNQMDLSSSGPTEPAGSITDPFALDNLNLDPAAALEAEAAQDSAAPSAAELLAAAEETASAHSFPPPVAAFVPPQPVEVPTPTPAPPPAAAAAPKQSPTIYFIDDSATMREVMKIAFRKEKLSLVACPDAASALSQFDTNPPDIVITDVIMPDMDGYSVCKQIKQNPRFSSTPVLLMSGVVNKTVADRAVSVHADELIRKPFQPNDLISRVRAFLNPKSPAPQAHQAAAPRVPAPAAPNPLGSIFAAPAAGHRPPAAAPPAGNETAWPRALAEAFVPQQQLVAPPQMPQRPVQPSAPQRPAAAPSADVQKYRAEILRLELLVKKLQTELQIEREYTQTLEAHCRAMQGTE